MIHMRTTTTERPTIKALTVSQKGERRFVTSQTMRGKLVYTIRDEKQRKAQ